VLDDLGGAGDLEVADVPPQLAGVGPAVGQGEARGAGRVAAQAELDAQGDEGAVDELRREHIIDAGGRGRRLGGSDGGLGGGGGGARGLVAGGGEQERRGQGDEGRGARHVGGAQ